MADLTDAEIAEVREVAATGGTLGVIRRDCLSALLAEVERRRSESAPQHQQEGDVTR